ncbi:MAG: class IV adenylate cyclase [Candidatus Staskawiczbacteria bacterium]|jgi:adenylate cyclase class 2
MQKNNILDIYKKIYDLPELSQTEKVDFNFFRLCEKNYNFVVVSAYNEKHEFLLTRDLNKDIGWELVGGYIKDGENIIDAANRVVLKETGLIIDELQPIAIINNNFKFNNGIITHRGIAFIALSRKKIKPQPENIKVIYTEDAPDKMAYYNKEIFKIAKEILTIKNFNPPYDEIDSAKKFLPLHLINKYFISIVGQISSRKIKKRILGLISSNPKSIIDVCCGDDSFIFQLERRYKPEIFVANDISWKTLLLLKNRNKKSDIIFTNHNVIDLPFQDKFDLVIFKNSLHHIDRGDQADLVKNFSDISKELIVVDIEDPNRSNFLSKIWHYYYVYFLGDVGGNFFTYGEFKEFIKNNIKGKEIKFGVIDTIKGRYFYSVLREKANMEEVEIKVKLNDSSVKEVRKELYKLGAILDGEDEERDTYFTAPHRDFIKTKECLRIREKGAYTELTYKGPTTKEMLKKKQFWKPEINIPFKGNRDDVETMLEMLSFKKVVDFTKHREKFLLGAKTITIDKIGDLGYFLEIEEVVRTKKDRERVLEENIEFLDVFKLSKKDIVEKPYRDLVIESNKS